MWLPKAVYDLFQISKENVDAIRVELAQVRAEKDALIFQLALSTTNSDWMRIRINALEGERAQLLYKLYNIDVPTPEIVRKPNSPNLSLSDMFEDPGDDEALRLGYPPIPKQ